MSATLFAPVQLTFQRKSAPETHHRVLGLEGHEALSQCFVFTLTLLIDGELSADDLEGWVGDEGVLRFSDGAETPVWGLIASLECDHRDAWGRSHLRLSLRPTLWALSLSTRSRVFLNKTADEIVREVIAGYGLEHGRALRFDLHAPRDVRPYTAQYQERDLDFIARLCEDEGIFFYWEHGDAQSTVVFAESNAGLRPYREGALHYDPRAEATGSDVVRTVRSRLAAQPAQVVVRAFQPGAAAVLATTQSVTVESARPGRVARTVRSLFGGPERSEGECNAEAQREAERLRCAAVEREMNTLAPGLHAGEVFSLVDHPDAALDIAWLCVRVTHQASAAVADDGTWAVAYQNTAVTLSRAQRYVPPKVTPRPTMPSLVHGVIAGLRQGTPAAVDHRGCYEVLMPFDTQANRARQVSAPVALLQHSAGVEYGAHFPLHVGAQVAIAHLYDDPDRPVIVGALPHGHGLPLVNADNATQSVLLTRGQVRVEFEDDAPQWAPAAETRGDSEKRKPAVLAARFESPDTPAPTGSSDPRGITSGPRQARPTPKST